MNATVKGLIGVILGLLGLFSAVWVDALHIRPIILFTAIIPLLISFGAVYFGMMARKGNARAVGIAGAFIGMIGVLSHALRIWSFLF